MTFIPALDIELQMSLVSECTWEWEVWGANNLPLGHYLKLLFFIF